MNMTVLLLIFAGIAALDVPGMVKSRQWRNLMIYAVLFLPILALGIMATMNIPIPSPIKAIQSFYQNVLHLTFK